MHYNLNRNFNKIYQGKTPKQKKNTKPFIECILQPKQKQILFSYIWLKKISRMIKVTVEKIPIHGLSLSKCFFAIQTYISHSI